MDTNYTPQHAPYKPAEGKRVWNYDSKGVNTQLAPGAKYKLIPANPTDIEKVQQLFLRAPPSGYDIASVEIIWNPNLGTSFETGVDALNQRGTSPAFSRKWHKEGNDIELRSQVYDIYRSMAKPHPEELYPYVKFLPMWHGTKESVIDSVCRTGMANLALTDSGYFGKGIYSAYEAEYSWRVYSKNGLDSGVLILVWNACFSAYPLINGDMEKFQSNSNYGNHDAHFVPVYPKDPHNPKEVSYYPCKKGQKAVYHELVVFNSVHCLPRYVVRLQAKMKMQMPSPAAPAKAKQQLMIAPGKAPSKENLQPKAVPLGALKQQPKVAPKQPPAKVYAANPEKAPLSTASSSKATSLEDRYQKAKDLLIKKDFSKAFAEFHELANASFNKAYFYKGHCYYYGLGTTQDYAKAIKYFLVTLEPNNQSSTPQLANACYCLGECLFHGKGCVKNIQKAYGYYKKAQELGSQEAITALKALKI